MGHHYHNTKIEVIDSFLSRRQYRMSTATGLFSSCRASPQSHGCLSPTLGQLRQTRPHIQARVDSLSSHIEARVDRVSLGNSPDIISDNLKYFLLSALIEFKHNHHYESNQCLQSTLVGVT